MRPVAAAASSRHSGCLTDFLMAPDCSPIVTLWYLMFSIVPYCSLVICTVTTLPLFPMHSNCSLDNNCLAIVWCEETSSQLCRFLQSPELTVMTYKWLVLQTVLLVILMADCKEHQISTWFSLVPWVPGFILLRKSISLPDVQYTRNVKLYLQISVSANFKKLLFFLK